MDSALAKRMAQQAAKAAGDGSDDLPALLMRFYMLREFDQATRVLLKLLQKGVMTGDFGMRQELTNVRLFFFHTENLLPSLFCSLCFFFRVFAHDFTVLAHSLHTLIR